MDKSIRNIIVGTATAIVLSGGGMFISLNTKVAVIQSQLEHIKMQIKEATSDRYQGLDAVRDFGIVFGEIEELKEMDDKQWLSIRELQGR